MTDHMPSSKKQKSQIQSNARRTHRSVLTHQEHGLSQDQQLVDYLPVGPAKRFYIRTWRPDLRHFGKQLGRCVYWHIADVYTHFGVVMGSSVGRAHDAVGLQKVT